MFKNVCTSVCVCVCARASKVRRGQMGVPEAFGLCLDLHHGPDVALLQQLGFS